MPCCSYKVLTAIATYIACIVVEDYFGVKFLWDHRSIPEDNLRYHQQGTKCTDGLGEEHLWS